MAPKASKSILYIVMLHIKSKVMKSTIQWCKKFAQGHVWGSLEVKSRILGPFYVHPPFSGGGGGGVGHIVLPLTVCMFVPSVCPFHQSCPSRT